MACTFIELQKLQPAYSDSDKYITDRNNFEDSY